MSPSIDGRGAVKNRDGDTHQEYRPDIDGLRAIAVLSVIGFHAFPRWLPGGFIGVDIFFVISGFLISSIILRGLQRGRFSYLDFYARRIRRIFPALLLVLTCSLVFGWFVLYAYEYKPLGKHVAGGAGFIANILFWREAGYFDISRDFKPLLHLWSLGVEEQFYIFWPLLLALFWKMTRQLLPLIAGLLLLSFVADVSLMNDQPTIAFYMVYARGWELLIGAALAYATLHWSVSRHSESALRWAPPNVLAWAGLVMLAAALLIVDENHPFPGWWALLPAMGTACLIAAGPAAFVNRVGLAWRPLVFVGLISYPAYLWHWPLLSFARILNYGVPPAAERWGLVLATFVCAWLTYRLLEKPIRSSKNPIVAVRLAALGILVAIAGLIIDKSQGLTFRAINADNPDYSKLLRDSKTLDLQLRDSYDRKATTCTDLGISLEASKYCSSYGPTHDAAGTIVLWGDSHGWAWAPVFYQLADQRHLRIVTLIHRGCPPLVGVRRSDPNAYASGCASLDTGETIVTAIRTIKPSHIFLIGRWSLYTHGWIQEGQLQSATHFITTDPLAAADQDSSKAALQSQLLKTLQILASQSPVTIFRTAPTLYSYVERGLLRNMPLEPSLQEYAAFESLPNRVIDTARSTLSNVNVIDPGSIMCERKCRVILGGRLLYIDDNHVSAQGALLFQDLLWHDYLGAMQQNATTAALIGRQGR